MDTNRVLIATALSMAVLLGWQFFFAPQQAPQPAPQQVAEQAAGQPAGQGAAQQVAIPAEPLPGMDDAPAPAPAAGRSVTVTTPLYTAQLNVKGGILESYSLAEYKRGVEPGSARMQLLTPSTAALSPLGIIADGQPTWATGDWASDAQDTTLKSGESATLTMTGTVNGGQLIRKLTFSADSYVVREELTLSGANIPERVSFTMVSNALTPEDSNYNATKVAYDNPDGLETEEDLDELRQGLLYQGPLNWGGVQDNYFLLGMAPGFEVGTFKARFTDDLYRAAVERTDLVPDATGSTMLSMDYYIGPKVKEQLEAAGHGLVESIDYGFFGGIAKPLMLAMNWFYSFTGNYGVAIILLTIIIKIVFFPLSQKSYKSMNEMKKLQPMMKKLKEKHGDDREAFNKELMQLYKTYKVNPMGGCIPMAVQIPVFLGLYNALLSSIELRHASFVSTVPFTDITWLADLSAKDPYYVTPIIMGITMFLQQRLTPAAGDPTQQKVMMFMPLIFTFFFLNFPAGLVVYWLVNNVLSIAQQWWMLRKA